MKFNQKIVHSLPCQQAACAIIFQSCRRKRGSKISKSEVNSKPDKEERLKIARGRQLSSVENLSCALIASKLRIIITGLELRAAQFYTTDLGSSLFLFKATAGQQLVFICRRYRQLSQ